MAPAPIHDDNHEAAYRAGYARGVAAVVTAIAPNLTASDQALIERWMASTLRPWSRIGISTKAPPPEFPKLTSAA
jgi:hypothetical protein